MIYDAIIIGGGLGGLAAGAALVRKQKKVLVLEQHVTVGGLAAGFTRKGYYFDSGMSRVNRMSVLMPLKELGIFSDADFAPHRSTYNIEGHAFDCDSVEGYFANLETIFPAEKAALRKLYEEQVRSRAELLSLVMGGGNGKPGFLGTLKILLKMPELMRESVLKMDFNETLRDYLGVQSRAFHFLSEHWDEVNYRGLMNPFMRTGKIYTQMKNDYPVNGFQGLCDKMAGYIRENGGEIRTKAKVRKILIEDGRCTGVEVLCHGGAETIQARNVISAIDLNKAFFGLIGEESVGRAYSEKLRKSELAAAIPILYLGLKIPSEKMRARFGGKEELFYYPRIRPASTDIEDRNHYKDSDMVIHSSSLINPSHAPEGCSSVQVYLKDAPRGWLNNWGIENGAKTEQYRKIKQMVIGQVLESLETVIPELRNRTVIEVCMLGTPYTIERYTGSSFGAGCGFTMDGDTMNPRVRGKYFDRLPGISNLYFAGHQTCWPGAAGAALQSGMHMADVIK